MHLSVLATDYFNLGDKIKKKSVIIAKQKKIEKEKEVLYSIITANYKNNGFSDLNCAT